MPLVVVCGQPSSGKSTVAAQLASAFGCCGLDVALVDEPSLHFSRDTSYDSTVNEKNTRAKLRSEVERAVSRTGITIMDTLNNIKGYRYELWCLARAAGTRYCMVHVDTPVETCRSWNDARPEDQRYPPAIFEDLAGRFERPDSRNRWDSPLFTVCPGAGPEDAAAVLEAIVRAMAEDVTSAASINGQVAKELQPTVATSNPALLSTNTLHDIDQATQDVIDAVMEAQAAAGGAAAGVVAFGAGIAPLQLRQPVTLAELRRHKRSFLKLATKITFARLSDAESARRMFVDFLRDNLQQQQAGGGS